MSDHILMRSRRFAFTEFLFAMVYMIPARSNDCNIYHLNLIPRQTAESSLLRRHVMM